MGRESISFSCPACDERLAVPRNLSGVIGPCPRCHAFIQAPQLVNPPQPAASHTKPYPRQPHTPWGRPDRLQQAILPAEPRQMRRRSEVPETPTRGRANNPSGHKPVLGTYVPPPQRRNKSRIMRTRPKFPAWALSFELAYQDEIANRSSIEKWLTDAGQFVGLCDYRPRFGRFEVDHVK